jgi:hypothetical protein
MIFASTVEHLADSFMGLPDAHTIRKTDSKVQKKGHEWAIALSLVLPELVWVFITAVPITKLFAWGEGDSGGQVLRETMRPRPVWISLPITH